MPRLSRTSSSPHAPCNTCNAIEVRVDVPPLHAPHRLLNNCAQPGATENTRHAARMRKACGEKRAHEEAYCEGARRASTICGSRSCPRRRQRCVSLACTSQTSFRACGCLGRSRGRRRSLPAWGALRRRWVWMCRGHGGRRSRLRGMKFIVVVDAIGELGHLDEQVLEERGGSPAVVATRSWCGSLLPRPSRRCWKPLAVWVRPTS